MKATWPHMIVAVSVFITGCASQPTAYTKAGISEAERKQDQTECFRQALGHVEPRHILVPVGIDQDEYRSCLKSKGYSVVTP